jgi:ParB-like chromosome segregation protein Spo0J
MTGRRKSAEPNSSVSQAQLQAIGSLLPYQNNARTHPKEQIAQLAASIEEFGFVGAIVVRNGVIAKGHGTLAAAQLLYAQGKPVHPAPGRGAGAKPYPLGHVPVLDVSGWSDAQFRAFVIADNKIAQASGWQDDLLKLELEELLAEGFDLDVTGFSEDELDALNGAAVVGAAVDTATLQPVYQVLIECTDEAEQLKILERLTADGVNCRALIA